MTWMNEDFDDLDDPTTYSVDPSGVYDWILKADRKLEDGTKSLIGKVDLADYQKREIREVIVCGMGGSAIAGDLAYAAVSGHIKIPYRVVRGYNQPGSLGANTLQIVISYSGNTEESIWAYTQGHNHDASVVVIASGGTLADLAQRHGNPFIQLPDDYLAPRLALGHLLPAVLSVLHAKFEGLDYIEEALLDSVNSLKHGAKRYVKDVPFEKNFAKHLAYDIHQAWPVVVASQATWPVALRFAAQLNENSKWPCHVAMLPEMNHNEIVAYSQPGPATKKSGLIMLRDKDDHPRVQFRQDFTCDMVENRMAWVHQVKGEGKTLLARLLSMVQTADFVSYYLACARGLDPCSITAIDSLKERLGKLQ